ncbi:MAG: ABC transporter substrate-binding protein [Clostridioides sp.]|jgi:oligopeptide transport system substrate-binding protein|nr:ABC transporter substrate-binding protein [Clostridioides sp.]
MRLKKKVSALSLICIMTATGLVGCGSSKKAGAVDGYAVLANENARKAIDLCIDRKQMCDVLLSNGSFPAKYFTATNLVKNEGKDYTDLLASANVDAGRQDDKEAAKYWAKAKEELGFDKVELEFLTRDTELDIKQAEFYQSEIQEALEGCTVKIQQLPFKQQLQKQDKREYQIVMAGWSPDYPDPLTFLDTMVTGKKKSNSTGYSNKEYDKLIDQAKRETDINKSWALYAKAEELMLKDMYIAPLYQRTEAYLQNPNVKGIVDGAFAANQSYKWADCDDHELNVTEASDIPSMDPAKATDTTSSIALSNTMEGLTRIDKNGNAIPGLAESWTTSEDGLTWTFKIRAGQKWSNGDPVTAGNFEYAWKRLLNPDTKSTYGWILYDIEGAEEANTKGGDAVDKVGVKAVDDNTLEVKLNRPVTYFEKLVFDARFLPVDQKFVEEKGDKFGTSQEDTNYCGPFTMSTWKLEDRFAMTKNPDYWDNSTVKLNTINFKIVKDDNARLNLYENGNVDRIKLSSDQVAKYKDSKDLKYVKESAVFYLEMNSSGKYGR